MLYSVIFGPPYMAALAAGRLAGAGAAINTAADAAWPALRLRTARSESGTFASFTWQLFDRDYFREAGSDKVFRTIA